MNALITNYSASAETSRLFFRMPRWLLPVCLLAMVSQPVSAARVPNLYGATVTQPEEVAEPLQEAFDLALSKVLVKVTGLPEVGDKETWGNLIPNSGSVVQQYSMQPDNQVEVEFDQKALRRILDGSGFPVWDVDRPLIAVWLAVDAGGGRRQIVSAGSPEEDLDESLADLRNTLTEVAAARGLPVIFPLVDAEDLAQLSFADIWGDFRQPVVAASARYGAEGVLIGRTRSADPDKAGVRWTLIVGDETAVWQGDSYSGPGETASFLSRRLATFADSAGALRVLVKNVASFDRYGELLRYFRSLSIIDEAGVARIDGNDVEFRIVARVDPERLESKLASSRLLVADEVPLEDILDIEFARSPDLVYSWRETE